MKGESIWLAEFLFLILSDFSSLCNSVGKKNLASRYLKKANDLKHAFDKHAWMVNGITEQQKITARK